ncbi:MAG: 2-hydroxychromene-2-carboxylate isomerase [Burkholderiales bacterium]|jgi:2-hydroxychromene-2-carboxylate isomerase
MTTPLELTAYIDYKSPFAYLAYDRIRALSIAYPIKIDWQPYILDLAAIAGPPEQRTERAQRKLRYSYMDARRQAAARGMILRSPRKLFDGRLAGMGLLFAKDRGLEQDYSATVLQRFWSHQLDLDDLQALATILSGLGLDADAFEIFTTVGGPAQLAAIQTEADAQGVFGVPTVVFEGELFWGGDRLELLATRLAARLSATR